MSPQRFINLNHIELNYVSTVKIFRHYACVVLWY